MSLDFILRVLGNTGEFGASEEQVETGVSEGTTWDMGKEWIGCRCCEVDETGWQLSWERARGREGGRMDLKVTEDTEGRALTAFPFICSASISQDPLAPPPHCPQLPCVAGSVFSNTGGSREDSESALSSRGSQPGGKTDLDTDEGEVVGNVPGSTSFSADNLEPQKAGRTEEGWDDNWVLGISLWGPCGGQERPMGRGPGRNWTRAVLERDSGKRGERNTAHRTEGH